MKDKLTVTTANYLVALCISADSTAWYTRVKIRVGYIIDVSGVNIRLRLAGAGRYWCGHILHHPFLCKICRLAQDYYAALDIPKKRSNSPLVGMAPARRHLAKRSFHTMDKINRDNVLG